MASTTQPAPARKLGKKTTAEEALQGIDVKGKVAVVTGGSSGIGAETCRALAKAGARVYLCARSRTAGESVIEMIKKEGGSDVHLLMMDLEDLASVKAAAEQLLAAESAIHMLILNAGVMACPLMYTKDGLELQTGVNHVAHFYLAQLLLPALQGHGTPARLVSVSSSAHAFGGLDVEDLNWEARAAAGKYGPWASYGQSKLCNILFVRELAKRLEGSSVLAFSLHPGIIKSKLQRYQSALFNASLFLLWPWFKTAEQGASTSIVAATGPEVAGASGSYLSHCRVEATKGAASDMALAGRLWTATEELLQRALRGELRREKKEEAVKKEEAAKTEEQPAAKKEEAAKTEEQPAAKKEEAATAEPPAAAKTEEPAATTAEAAKPEDPTVAKA